MRLYFANLLINLSLRYVYLVPFLLRDNLELRFKKLRSSIKDRILCLRHDIYCIVRRRVHGCRCQERFRLSDNKLGAWSSVYLSALLIPTQLIILIYSMNWTHWCCLCLFLRRKRVIALDSSPRGEGSLNLIAIRLLNVFSNLRCQLLVSIEVIRLW